MNLQENPSSFEIYLYVAQGFSVELKLTKVVKTVQIPVDIPGKRCRSKFQTSKESMKNRNFLIVSAKKKSKFWNRFVILACREAGHVADDTSSCQSLTEADPSSNGRSNSVP